MSLKEGPLFGAGIIAVGVAYLVYRKTGQGSLALLAGVGVGLADYVLILAFNRIKKD